MWPRSCLYRTAMELVKGLGARQPERQDEDRFRYPAHEDVWEVPYSEECEYEERETRTIVRKRPDFRLLRRAA